MSYYEPSSVYGLESIEKVRWDSGVSGVDPDYWSLLGPCQVRVKRSVLDLAWLVDFQDCRIAIPELKQKLELTKQEKMYLGAQKGFLQSQLDSSLTLTSQLEAEVTGLRYELREREKENHDLRSRLKRLEVKWTFRISDAKPHLTLSSTLLNPLCGFHHSSF